jgi:XTP/dITP diphosphohydrolase
MSPSKRKETLEAFGRLLDVMDELREKCPWDRKQTNESLRANTIEETYELCDALMRNQPDEIKKELGDLLLHVVLYAKIGEEKGDFDIKAVCDSLCEKLIFRHPHVFGEHLTPGPSPKERGERTVGANLCVRPIEKSDTDDSRKIEQSWEQLKMKEKDGNKTVLDGVPAALPSLIKAYRIQDKARNVGFDWEVREQVWDKVQEELNELRNEIGQMNADRMEDELGDFLFSLINAARLYKINPDNALERTNQKFIRRFAYLEEHTLRQGRSLKDMTLAEMDIIWEEAKKQDSYDKE